MFKRILKNYLINKSFKKKIIFSTLFSALIPLLVLTFFSFLLIQHFVIEKEKSNNLDILNAARSQVEGTLSSYEDSLSFLVNSNQLINGLSLNTPTNFEQYHFYVNDIVPLFKTIMYQHPDIQEITLFTSLNFYNHGKYVKKIIPGDITEKLHLNVSTDSSYYFDNRTNELYLYSHLFSKKSKDTNLIVIKLDAAKLFEPLSSLSNEPYKLTINNEDTTIFSFSNEETVKKNLLNKSIQLVNPYSITHSKTIAQTGWTFSFSRPYAQLYKNFLLLILATMGIFILSILLLTLFASKLSKSIVSPIESLAKEMISAPTTNFTLTYYYESKDEIGLLYKQFRNLLLQINTLIDEVYEAEITQKKYELRSLQNQINPHFFYNSLSLINNKAIITGNEEISEMALLLSQYYRLSLNGGQQFTSVDKELELTITYAKIQQKMHHYSFDLDVMIDEELTNFQIINLVIQPFVENAIFHGLDHIDDGRKGKLSIQATVLSDNIQFTIKDNGAGMDSETLSSLFLNSGEHYGLKNVQQRIFLYYGKLDAITYQSTLGKGSVFVITIPKHT